MFIKDIGAIDARTGIDLKARGIIVGNNLEVGSGMVVDRKILISIFCRPMDRILQAYKLQLAVCFLYHACLQL